MLTFFMAGGAPMIVITLAGGLCLGSAIFFARMPTPGAVPRVISLSVAVFITSAVGVLADVGATFHAVAAHEEWPMTDAFRILLQGLSESMSPAIWGGAFLVITWLLMALGFRRLGSPRA